MLICRNKENVKGVYGVSEKWNIHALEISLLFLVPQNDKLLCSIHSVYINYAHIYNIIPIIYMVDTYCMCKYTTQKH